MKLYDHPLSGNGYKVRLLLSHLGRDYDYVPVDIFAGEATTDSFRAKNPFGKVPLLELDDGRRLPESNAILFLLAQQSRYWPVDPVAQATVLSWLFYEQRSYLPSIGGARYWLTLHRSELTPKQHELVRSMQDKAKVGLAMLDRQLSSTAYVAGHAYTIADMSLYAYTHVAHEARIELAPYPAVQRWLGRVQGQPGYVDMQRAVA